MLRLEGKLARIRSGAYSRNNFVLAAALDSEMGPGIQGAGPARPGEPGKWRSRETFIDGAEAVIKQDVVDIMLLSASNLERLVARDAFGGTGVKPAIRANDATDVWVVRGSPYATKPSRPFRTASLPRVRSGGATPHPNAKIALTDLGLYSVTFSGDLDADLASLEAFNVFRAEAAACDFRYFLEVFNPNAGLIPADVMPYFVNDSIVRCLAGLTEAERPRFLKVVYNGPRALDELASFDPSLIVGVLGGGAGTTRDCFELIFQAEKYGARVALFGRKINLAESPLDMVKFMRAVADGALKPLEAVKAYHEALLGQDLKPARDLAADSEITEAVLKQG